MKSSRGMLAALWAMACAVACAARTPPARVSQGQTASRMWGQVEGQTVMVFTLRNVNGLEAAVSNFGGALLSLRVPDRNGRFDDVVRGYDNLKAYEQDAAYFGTIVGRFANRIAGGVFQIDGNDHQLARNEGNNAIHGGIKGFNRVVWSARETQGPGERGVELRYDSPDGDEGYPGNLNVIVRYVLTDADELRLEYEATTDRPTIVNLTNHSYYNLAGLDGGDILGHVLTINAEAYTPVDEHLIPTGALAAVDGTPFDFRNPTPIGAHIQADDVQLRIGKGYDHNWVLARRAGQDLQLACRVYEPKSGRVMELLTTEPGLQFYSGNFLNGSIKGKGGRPQGHREAFVLEAQHFPDSPHHPSFPSTELRPGSTYKQTTVLHFPRPE